MPAQRADIHGPARAAFGVLEVEACAERIGAAGEHYRRGSAVVLKTARGIGELTQRFRRQRVDAVATVEAHHGDAALGPEAFFDLYKVCQGRAPCPLCSWSHILTSNQTRRLSKKIGGFVSFGDLRSSCSGVPRLFGRRCELKGRNKEH